MDENEKAGSDTTAKESKSRFLWLLILIAVVALWWWYRPEAEQTQAQLPSADDVAAVARFGDPDDVIIDLKDSASPAAIEHDLGLQLALVDLSGEAAATKLYRAHVDPARRDAILATLAARADVEIAEPDGLISLSPDEMVRTAAPVPATEPGFPNDPQYKYQWHLNQIGMPEAWKLADGNGVIVAVLDTGVGFEEYGKFHELPDLKGITFVEPFDFITNTKHASDDHGHGSHVTGTIAQVTNNGIGVAGIARNVKIMPLKVLSGSGSGSVAGIADAIRYAADHGAKVINMSLGGPMPSNVLKKAVKYAHDKGVTVVCAAGNDGSGRVGYPAAYDGAVAVSATQFDESITFYSQYGKALDIAAPGGNTRVDQNGDGQPDGVLQNTLDPSDGSKNGYYAYMGTSMASPHVAGVAALVVGEGITDPKMVEEVLKSSARKPTDQKYDVKKYGAGIVDAPAAVKEARTQGGGFQLGLGLLMAGAVAASVRRRGVRIGWTYLAGVVVGSSGLFFLPMIAPALSSAPIIYTLTHGLPSWDLSILGPVAHGNALFFSAAIPLALLVVCYGMPRARAPLAGLAIGVAAHLAFFAAVPWMPVHVPMFVPILGGTLPALWLVANVVACLGLARLALRR